MTSAEIDPAQVEALREAIGVLVRAFKIADGGDAGGAAIRLNPSDAQAILFVHGRPGCSAGDVARFLGVVPTTATAVIDRLVRQGLVDRRRSENNRRLVRLSVSDDGTAVVRAILDEQRAHCRHMLSALDPDERRALVDILAKVAGTAV